MRVLSPNTEELLRDRYYLRDPKGKLIENSWEEACTRVSNYVATGHMKSVNATPVPAGGLSYPHPKYYGDRFFEIMESQEFSPNSPTWFNAGNPYASQKALSACYILHVPDDIPGIFQAVKEGAIIGKTGGGIGMDGSQIRPYGTETNSGGIASGVMSFMGPFQAMSEAIIQGGRRRIAMMWMLAVWHPEILLFIDSKKKTGPMVTNLLMQKYGVDLLTARNILKDLNWLTVKGEGTKKEHDQWKSPFSGFNISVKISNEFMDCVHNDKPFMLRRAEVTDAKQNGNRAKEVVYHPWTGPVLDPRNAGDDGIIRENIDGLVTDIDGVKYVHARRLWYERIVQSAWASAEPGIMFDDIVNEDNPVASLGPIHNSNPCGEYFQVDHNSCNLGSINVSKFFKLQRAKCYWWQKVDWKKLANVTRSATRFLDYVIEQNEYPLQEITDTTRASRPVGLGVMGVADLLIKLGIRYGSDQAIEVSRRVMQWIQYHAWLESTALAKEFGSFPELVNNKPYFDRKMLKLTKDMELHPMYLGSLAGELEDLYARYLKYGVRNCHVIVIAPTGTISLLLECSSGVEPIFAFLMKRQDTVGVRWYVHDLAFDYLLAQFGMHLPDNCKTDDAKRTARDKTTEFLFDAYADKLPEYFVDTNHVTPIEHVKMQAAFQEFCDNAISKTCNMPEGSTVEDVAMIYDLAFALKLKGITVYIDGSREGVLIREDKQPKTETAPVPALANVVEFPSSPAMKLSDLGNEKVVLDRPQFLEGGTYVIPDGHDGKMYLTSNHTPDGRIVEVFLRENAGNEWTELAGRLISLLLRSNVPVKEIRQQLRRVGGQSAIWYNGKCFTSAVQLIDEVVFEQASPYFTSKLSTGTSPLGESSTEYDLAPPSEIVPLAQHQKCPDCGQRLIAASGCMECSAKCGYSKCK